MAKKRVLTRLLVMLFIVALLLPKMCSIAYATNYEDADGTTFQKGIVISSGLNFREQPNTSSKVKKVLRKGTEVIILEEGEEWLKVLHDTEDGYLYKKHVEILTAKGIVTSSSLNVRSEPTTNSQTLDILYKGMRVIILEEIQIEDPVNPVWLKVKYLDNRIGYISKRYVKIQTNRDGSYLSVGFITATMLNMRSEPSVFSKIIGQAEMNSNVIIFETKHTDDFYGTWYKVDCKGVVGWVAEKYVEKYEWILFASATTKSSSSGKNRNHNISLVSNTLSGTIIMPGEKFSWLETLGSCSGAKGYKEATVFVNGEKAEGTGGGVCQVSTTINIAAKNAGIMTNAKTHSLPVSYASREDEATVSYPYVDFSFVNTFDEPILVDMVTSGGSVTCNILLANVIDK